MIKSIKKFITHPAISQSWLAEQIYGDRSSKNRKKISVKISEEQPLSELEIAKIEEIKKIFLKNIK